MSMKKLKLLFAACALLVTAGVQAKTDVTSTYLVDADLSSLSGWGNPGKTDWKTDGAVNVVEFWNWSNQFNFSQTANLPAGYYRLAVNAFYRNSWGGDGTNNDMAWIFAGEKTQNVIALNSMNDLSGYAGSSDLYRAATAFSQGKFSNEFDFNVTGEGTVAVEIGFKGTCPNGGWCILGPVTLWEYTAEDYMEDYREKVAIAEPLLTQKMNADVLQALNDAIVEESTLTTVDDVQNAVSTLIGAINDANTSISNYESLKDAIDAFDANYAKLDSYGKDAADAAGAYDAKNAYTNGTATDGATEKATLNTAFRAGVLATQQPGDGLDMTAYVTNPDFDNGSTDPWIKVTPKGGNCAIQGGSRMEYWAGNANPRAEASFNIYQELTNLPAGAYTISADMYNSLNGEGGDYTVFSPTCGVYGASDNEEVALVTVEGTTLNTYTTGEVIVATGNLTIGTKNTVTPMAARWFLFDNVKLTYARQLTSEEITGAYNTALAAAQAFDGTTIPTAANSDLQTVITNNTLTSGTPAEYNAAATALNEAVAAASALVDPYAAWKALKAQAEALVTVSNDNEDANSTLSDAITTQESAADAATTADEINSATSTLKTEMVTYVGVANPVGENAKFDCTFMLTNPDVSGFENGSKPDGWYCDYSGDAWHNPQVNRNAVSLDGTKNATFEFWTGTAVATNEFTVYQKVNLPAGTYTMSCLAFADANDVEGATNNQVYFYANDTEGSKIVSETNKLADASISFVNDSEQEVKIGLKACTGNQFRWMGIGYVELYKIPAQAYTVDEDLAWDYEQSGAGDVTLNRTIKAGVNTLVLPFSMTQDEVESTFGEGSVVYVVDSYDSDKNSISFKQKSGISPNEPCLLKAAEEGTSYSLLGRTIVAASANPTIGGTDVTMTGSYAATAYIPLNSYVVNGGNLYKVDQEESVSMKNTRAYITVPKSADARTITISFDNGATGIATLDGGEMKFEAGTIYDLSGRKVTNPAKGIYIMNGKKVIK